jgi:hypothetical protein
MSTWEAVAKATTSANSYYDDEDGEASPEKSIRRPTSRESDENESNGGAKAWNSAVPVNKASLSKMTMPKGAPPKIVAPSGPAPLRSAQDSKALVEKIKANAMFRSGKGEVEQDQSDDSAIEEEDEDYIKNPRIPVPCAEQSLADESKAESDSDEKEMNELQSEVEASGFMSHRAMKKNAKKMSESRLDKLNREKGNGVQQHDSPYESLTRSQYDSAARDDSFDLKDLEVLDSDKAGDKILHVFHGGAFEVSPSVIARDNFFKHSGLHNKDGVEVIGRAPKKGPHCFSIIAHDHGFMPLSTRSTYKGQLPNRGTVPSARNGAADDGEFFETDKVYCTILRDRFTSKMYPEYQLILDSTQKPLLLAKKMKGNKTSNYHIFDMSRGRVALKGGAEFDKKSGNYLGKLRASGINGSDYVLYGNENSSSTSDGKLNNFVPTGDVSNESEIRRELGAISYERLNYLSQFKSGSQPRKLSIVIPPLDAEAVPVANTYMQKDRAQHSLEKCLKDPVEATARECYTLVSKEPTFENGNYRLNFSGRVTLPSVKNFQLVSTDNKSDIICQFGKVGDDTFHLDFKRPVTAMQAFAFALSQFNL